MTTDFPRIDISKLSDMEVVCMMDDIDTVLPMMMSAVDLGRIDLAITLASDHLAKTGRDTVLKLSFFDDTQRQKIKVNAAERIAYGKSRARVMKKILAG